MAAFLHAILVLALIIPLIALIAGFTSLATYHLYTGVRFVYRRIKWRWFPTNVDRL